MKNRAKRNAYPKRNLFLRCVAAFMSCFFGCLRAKNSPSISSSSSASASASPEVAIRKRNRLASLISSESVNEEECRNLENDDEPNSEADVDMRELEDEANFLKACGTLSQTPPEIQKIKREGKCQSDGNDDPQDSRFKSWLDVIPTEQCNIEKKEIQPLTPAQKCEELAKGDASFRHNSGAITIRSDAGNNEEQNAMTSKLPADERVIPASVAQSRKSVRFYCDTGASLVQDLSPEIDNETSEDPGAASICKTLRDPYPTPLRLNDEMQTPGTVFSAYQDDMADGKKTRIRSQYVTSVLNSVENVYQWQGMKAEVSEFCKISVELEEALEDAEVRESLSGKELNVESNLASWLQENVTNQDDNHAISQDKVPRVPTVEDQPILGLVASHWNDPPKSWDGNGIPNTTSKYKEDQKVSFHLTPFVERLEKALSEDTIIPRSQVISLEKPSAGRQSPIEMSGLEESDTALLKLQSSGVKTVASC